MSMDDESQARNRLLAYTAMRFGGLVIFFFGVAVIYTNLLRPGGWPQVGAIIAIVGVIDAFFAPRILKRGWERQDQQRK
jgi:membrane protein implicated in regulation of membrane protease activity